ncbi:MAG: hypothetical protein A2234_08195 [Elusimicrobia bacterium RIFOXYA2_FULL_58_8]|nr:MAG: hypothetical protein A2285_01330 [Elusimicrobia bacterium RIFOXYA12_FULL_57_11]OGS17056.1 MAG: hypothetical protein A2234_08195 [Elusimicrobia bacterium RIFOXYA2_FULL_58_8]
MTVMKDPARGPAIRVENLGKRFLIGVKAEKESFLGTTRRLMTGWTRQRELWALRNVSFSVEWGETFGIIGPNGAGKSTLLLLLAQILAPTEGRCLVSSRTHCFFRLGAALQPRLTVLENFSLCSALLGLDRAEFRRRLPGMIAFSGLEDYLYARYGDLSTGLAARLPFSAAIHADLDTILVDEMLMVGDRAFQAKCLKAFRDLKARGKTLVMVSHSLPQIEELCSRALYLNAGRTAFLGDSAAAVRMLSRDLGGAGYPGARVAPGDARGGIVPPFAEKTREIVDAWVKNLHLALQTPALKGCDAASGTAAAAGDAVLLGQVRGIVEAETQTLCRELIACAGQSPAARPGSGPDAELAWKNLLGHAGPLAVCASVPAAFGAVLRSLMAGPEKRSLKPGDEVILVAGIWSGLAEGLLYYGLVPVFVDLDAQTWNMDIKQLPQALSGRTRAVILSHETTCAPLEQAAAFCAENDLRLVEFVHSASLLGRYRGKPLGTLGEYAVYAPGRPDQSAWALALARNESAAAILEKALSGPAVAAGESPAVQSRGQFLQPVKGSGPALTASLAACADWAAQVPDLEAGFAAYSDFFSRFPDYFIVPLFPPAARLAAWSFTVMLKKDAPFTMQELVGAGIENKARRRIKALPVAQRQINELPRTREFNERAVSYQVLRGARERERFFAEMRGWLLRR